MNLQKMKRFLKSAAVTLVTAAMCFGAVSPVMAEGGATGTEDAPAKLDFNTSLEMDEHLSLPDVQFDYTIEGDNGAPEFAISEDNKLTQADLKKDGGSPLTVYSYSEKIDLSNLYTKAGKYTYTVSERVTLGQNEKGTIRVKESYINSYEVDVLVKNNAAMNGIYVAEVAVYKDGERAKRDGLYFANVYTKNTGNLDNGALTLTKKVTGEFADQTKDFTFEVTLHNAATATANQYTATVTRNEGNSAPQLYTFTPDRKTTVTLRHGEVLTFTDLPIGTTYDINETANENYKASVSVFADNVESTKAAEDYNEALAIGVSYVGETPINSVTYTNEFNKDSITPTGFLIDNMPFILLIVVGVVGIGAYMVSRRRRYQG